MVLHLPHSWPTWAGDVGEAPALIAAELSTGNKLMMWDLMVEVLLLITWLLGWREVERWLASHPELTRSFIFCFVSMNLEMYSMLTLSPPLFFVF